MSKEKTSEQRRRTINLKWQADKRLKKFEKKLISLSNWQFIFSRRKNSMDCNKFSLNWTKNYVFLIIHYLYTPMHLHNKHTNSVSHKVLFFQWQNFSSFDNFIISTNCSLNQQLFCENMNRMQHQKNTIPQLYGLWILIIKPKVRLR